MNKQTNYKLLYSIGIWMTVLAIPQILFFRLVPEIINCRLTVYGFMTAFCVCHMAFCVLLKLFKGTRVSAAPILVNSVLFLIELFMCIVLLLLNAKPENAACTLAIMSLVHISVEAIFCSTIE